MTIEAKSDGDRVRLWTSVTPPSVLAITDSLLCGILASASRELILGLESELDTLRAALVRGPRAKVGR